MKADEPSLKINSYDELSETPEGWYYNDARNTLYLKIRFIPETETISLTIDFSTPPDQPSSDIPEITAELAIILIAILLVAASIATLKK